MSEHGFRKTRDATASWPRPARVRPERLCGARSSAPAVGPSHVAPCTPLSRHKELLERKAMTSPQIRPAAREPLRGEGDQLRRAPARRHPELRFCNRDLLPERLGAGFGFGEAGFALRGNENKAATSTRNFRSATHLPQKINKN